MRARPETLLSILCYCLPVTFFCLHIFRFAANVFSSKSKRLQNKNTHKQIKPKRMTLLKFTCFKAISLILMHCTVWSLVVPICLQCTPWSWNIHIVDVFLMPWWQHSNHSDVSFKGCLGSQYLFLASDQGLGARGDEIEIWISGKLKIQLQTISCEIWKIGVSKHSLIEANNPFLINGRSIDRSIDQTINQGSNYTGVQPKRSCHQNTTHRTHITPRATKPNI